MIQASNFFYSGDFVFQEDILEENSRKLFNCNDKI